MKKWLLVCMLCIPIAAFAVTLAWEASSSPEVTGYKIHHGTTSGAYTTTLDVGNVLSVTIDNSTLASPGMINYIAATAYAPDIPESAYSNEVTYTVAQTSDTEPPSTPGTPSITVISSSQLALSWGSSTDNVGVTGYHVERCTGASCATGFSEIAQPTSNNYSNTGLTASTTYGYRVRATDASANLSGYSGTGYGTTQTALTSGLVAAWGFAEGSGTVSADHSGNGHTITLQGATWTTSGHTAAGLAFSGATQYATTPHMADLSLGSTGTIEVWVFLSAGSRWHGIISKGTGNSDAEHNYGMEITDTNAVYCALGNGSVGMNVTGGVLNLNTWYHLACTWDGSLVQLYINGVATQSAGQSLTPAGNTVAVSLGQWNGNVDYLQGKLDDVRIYNTALNATQISTDMNTPVGAGNPPTGSVLSSVVANP